MKKTFKTLAFTLAATTSLMAASAQAADKIGIVNVQAVVQQLPQMAQIQETIREEFKEEMDAIKKIEKDIAYYGEKYQRDKSLMTPEQIKELEKQITDLQKDYATKGKTLENNLRRRQGEEQNKILALVKQAIDNVAEAGKFDIVLQQNAVAYQKDIEDISSKVVEQVSKLN